VDRLAMLSALLPRLLAAPEPGAELVAASPAELAGTLGNWQIPAWTRTAGDGLATGGPSGWKLDGTGDVLETCSYTLAVVRSEQAPDGLSIDEIADFSPVEGQPRRVLRVHARVRRSPARGGLLPTGLR